MSEKGAYEFSVVQRGEDFYVIATPNDVARRHGFEDYEGGPYKTEEEANGKRDQAIEAIQKAIPKAKVHDGN